MSMSNLTRRAILRGSSAAAVSVILPSIIANASTEGDPVLPLVERWAALDAEMKALSLVGKALSAPSTDHEDRVADLNDLMVELEGEIAAMPAGGFAGLRAKLMIATFGPGISSHRRLPKLMSARAWPMALPGTI